MDTHDVVVAHDPWTGSEESLVAVSRLHIRAVRDAATVQLQLGLRAGDPQVFA